MPRRTPTSPRSPGRRAPADTRTPGLTRRLVASARSMSVRAVAVGLLVRVDEEGAWASRMLEAQGDSFDARDLALLQEIVLGVLRWRGALDGVLTTVLRKPIGTLEPAVRESLRVGAYQLLFLDRVPDHAAVDESVTIARRSSGTGAAALVNAVLRKIASRRKELSRTYAALLRGGPEGGVGGEVRPAGESPRPVRGLARRLATELSHPEWMVSRALARFGEEEARAWLLANNRTPPLSLRPNPLHPESGVLAARLAEQAVETAPGGFAPGALQVVAGKPPRTALFASGAFWIQDEASQVVPMLFPPPWDGWTADLCAAPGGKAFVLATGPWRADASRDVPDDPPGRVVAFDRHVHRLARLTQGASRIAPGRIGAVAADLAAGLPAAAASFDRALVDAPCSGTGVLRRHPEIRWRLAPAHLAELADLQSRLLDAGYALLRPGGHLVYSVCSIEPEEGDHVIDAFLSRSDAEAVDPRAHLHGAARDAIDASGRLRTYPHRQGSDGFFAALVRKPAQAR